MTVFLQSDLEAALDHNSDYVELCDCVVSLHTLCKRKETFFKKKKKVERVLSLWAKLKSYSTIRIVSPLSARGRVFLYNSMIPKKRSSLKTDPSISIGTSIWLVSWDGILRDLMRMDCMLKVCYTKSERAWLNIVLFTDNEKFVEYFNIPAWSPCFIY